MGAMSLILFLCHSPWCSSDSLSFVPVEDLASLGKCLYIWVWGRDEGGWQGQRNAGKKIAFPLEVAFDSYSLQNQLRGYHGFDFVWIICFLTT